MATETSNSVYPVTSYRGELTIQKSRFGLFKGCGKYAIVIVSYERYCLVWEILLAFDTAGPKEWQAKPRCCQILCSVSLVAGCLFRKSRGFKACGKYGVLLFSMRDIATNKSDVTLMSPSHSIQ